jgi:outer membrane biosynthesis protein TonB
MKARYFLISSVMLVISSACNNASDSKATTDSAKPMATDTVAAAPAPVEPPPPAIDSAAITREYLAARKTAKKTTPPKPKKQGTNEVEMYSEPPMPTHEVLEQPAPVKATPAAPAPPPVIIHTKEYVYFTPSQKASFPGGNQALSTFINSHLVYPEDALKYHVEGTVFAEVYLDSIGNVTQVETPGKHLGSGLEEETVAVLMQSPRWHPAKENGQMVKSKVTIPVTYKIEH